MTRKAQWLAFPGVIACLAGAWAALGPADLVAQQVTSAPPYIITHLYTDAQGVSRFKDMEIKNGELIKAVGVQLSRRAAANNTFNDWHREAVRRIIVVLSGRMEMMVTDNNTVKSFGPGDAVFLEEKTGPGHKTRTVGNFDVKWVFIELDHHPPAAPRPAAAPGAAPRPAPVPPQPIIVTSMYTGPDGKAHYREKEVKSNTEHHSVGVIFTRRAAAANTFNAWHGEPNSRYIIPLGGSKVEMMVGDDMKNETKSFGVGDIALMETTGDKAGHRTRTVTQDGQDVRWMFVELEEPHKK